MKRIDFIKGLIGMGGAIFLSGKFAETRNYQKFYLLQSFVRGFRHYEGPGLLHQMKEGDMLELVREPDNQYDRCAIALHWNQHKIGFLPAEDNFMLSKLLDIGVPELIAEIIFLKPEAATWENVNIAVYVLKEIPSSGSISPTAAYLTELETPRYRTLKRADDTITRVTLPGYVKMDDELDIVDAHDWMSSHAQNVRVKELVDSSLEKEYDYSSQVDFLVVNRKTLTEEWRDKLNGLESELYNAEKMFAEDGYMVLAVDKMEEYIGRISGITEVSDVLGRKFLELKF
jgi:hypothetical protein